MKTKIIIALDDMADEAAFVLAGKLAGVNVLFKADDLLDSELGAKRVIERLGIGEVMADPKLHDIPKTVGNRTKRFAAYGPKFLTVHASGGIEMIRAAVENRGATDILAVTVLTSLNEEECTLNLGGPVKAKALLYARNALIAGAQGIVCSAQELEFFSKFPELKNLIKVTPGIRPVWHLDPKDDQKRIMTPEKAVKLGADYLVIGRPITKAADPVEALEKTIKEIETAEAAVAA